MNRICKSLASSKSSAAVASCLAAALVASLSACAVELDDAGVGVEQAPLDPAASRPADIIRTARPVAGQYIVVLRDDQLAETGESASTAAAAMAPRGTLLATYEHALRGFALRADEAEVRALLSDPRVAYIVEDTAIELDATQLGATWGLDRIDQREQPINTVYTHHATGAGVHAYILDTGIRLTHQELAGRIGAGFDAVTPGGNASDCHGHGTHVAGTVGGTTYGVAKAVTLHPVRVFPCNGLGSATPIIAGLNWVVANHVAPAVINMSLGGPVNPALDAAVAQAIAAGITVVVAAGNSNADACSVSPARVGPALTVGATDRDDRRASFSNHGSCLDLFAPGVAITSAGHGSDSAIRAMDGTSMAAPHATGVAALYLEHFPGATPAQVVDRLIRSAVSSGVVIDPGPGSPNRLLNNGLVGLSFRTALPYYLTAEHGGNAHMTADRTALHNWERFDVADLDGGVLDHGDFIHLRAARGPYVVAEGGGGGVVNANRLVAGPWETFRVLNLDGRPDFRTGDRVALQAANGQYVVAEGGGGLAGPGSVNANRSAIGPWETFIVTVH